MVYLLTPFYLLRTLPASGFAEILAD